MTVQLTYFGWAVEYSIGCQTGLQESADSLCIFGAHSVSGYTFQAE